MKLLSIILGTCGTVGLDLRGFAVVVDDLLIVVIEVVNVVVAVVVGVVVGAVAFDFFSLDNI